MTYDGVKYQLSPEKLNVDSDVDGMVDHALEASQDGGLPTRVWRYATGGEVDVAISPQVSYSNQAIDEFVGQGRRRGRHRPGRRDDRAELGLARGRRRPYGTLGRRWRRCARGSSPRSSAPTTARSPVPVEEVQPEVTKADLAAAVPDLPDGRRVELHADACGRTSSSAKQYTVAVGQPAYPTPTGLYSIESKQVDPVWSVPNSRLGR